MKKRAAVHPFDVALGLVWLTIIFVGILYLITRTAPGTATVSPAPIERSDRMDVLRTLQSDSSVPSEDERLRIVSQLSGTSESDDRASVYPGSEPEITLDEKLKTLESLRTAR